MPPSKDVLPSRITDHKPNDDWNCTLCIERWPCHKLRLVAIAYFWNHPSELVEFMAAYYERARRDKHFRLATAKMLHERFFAWIAPLLDHYRHAQAAWSEVATRWTEATTKLKALGRATVHVARATTSPWFTPQRGRYPVMGQPPAGHHRSGHEAHRGGVVSAGRRG